MPGRVQLKFVVTNQDDYDDMWRLLDDVGAAVPEPVLVQPDGTRHDCDAALRELTDRVLADDGEFHGRQRRALLRHAAGAPRHLGLRRARGVTREAPRCATVDSVPRRVASFRGDRPHTAVRVSYVVTHYEYKVDAPRRTRVELTEAPHVITHYE